jgi:NAD(P)H-nitrite reductase large subunit
VLVKLAAEENVYRKIVLKDGVLVGAVLVGNIERAGILTGLMLNRVNVEPFKEFLLREDFGLVHLSVEMRKEILAANL